ncbi:hypothetical protein TWF569_004868 [Orbilia oligospora]|nr:hypothetical protein TWF569_004868 [Orbilia oligospora]
MPNAALERRGTRFYKSRVGLNIGIRSTHILHVHQIAYGTCLSKISTMHSSQELRGFEARNYMYAIYQ